MNLDNIRENINAIDDQLAALFEERMNLAHQVGTYKAERNLPILDTGRERDIICRVTKVQDDVLAEYTKVFFTALFDLSRSAQNRKLHLNVKLADEIRFAIKNTPVEFPKSAVVACQGIEGSNSQLACEKLFSRPQIMYMNSFDSVFTAVDKGLCKYGILPVENSLHGSVSEVYDLMKTYRFSIAKSVKVKINHVLLAKENCAIGDIKEIYSHEQALAQCSDFCKNLGVTIIPCENTAIAAKKVQESDRTDIAAISSSSCAELYGLSIIENDIQNNDNNYTRFICISKAIEIYPGASKISLLCAIPHRPGSLYNIISKFSSMGVNLTKLESRPIPGMDFEFMFYIDLDANLLNEEVVNLICGLSNSSEIFAFLGNYSEI